MSCRGVFAVALIVGGATIGSAETPGDPTPTPYAVLGDTPYEYTGPQGDEPEPENLEEVRIGLFVPSDGPGPAIRKGAELAISEANAAGSFHGSPFVLIEKSSDQTWGSAREVVNLVYEHEVWAIIGGADAESTHVAEQIATKAQLPLLSPASSEASLTQINIPWMFRVMPSDAAFARSLVDHLTACRIGVATCLVAPTLDHRSRARAFAKELELRGGTVELTTEIAAEKSLRPGDQSQAVVVFAEAPLAWKIIGDLRRGAPNLPIFGGPGLLPEGPNRRGDGIVEGVVVSSPWDPGCDEPVSRNFVTAFENRYGELPAAEAALAYDSVGVLISAIRNAGLNRARIRDALAATEGFSGATGTVVFDGTGSRLAVPILMIVQADGRVTRATRCSLD